MQAIAIIDDGVSSDLYNVNYIKKSIEINSELEIRQIDSSEVLKNSHGTICAAIFSRYYSKANIISIKILDSKKERCEKKQLIEAIKWCIDNKIKVINMSIGSVNYKDFNEINTIIRKAYEAGCIIVAACHNRDIFTMPASSQYVIGVKADKKSELKDCEYIFNSMPLDGIDITSNGRHLIKINDGNKEETELCNSYATPLITALICKIIDEEDGDITLKKIKDELLKRSVNFLTDISNKDNEKKVYISYLERKRIDVPIIALFNMTESYNNSEEEKLIVQNFREQGYYAMGISIVEEDIKNELECIYININKNKQISINEKAKILYRIYKWDLAIIDIMLKDKDNVVCSEIVNDLCPDQVIYLLDEFKYNDIKHSKRVKVYKDFLVEDDYKIYLTNKITQDNNIKSLYRYLLNKLI